MIVRVALVLRRLAVDVHPYEDAELKTSKIVLERLVSLVC
jgi:hypothetical protein